jgi:hypothetical protein
MPTVAFDVFELDQCGVSAAEMATVVVQNNGVLSDTVKAKLRNLLIRNHFRPEDSVRVSRPTGRDLYIFHQP